MNQRTAKLIGKAAAATGQSKRVLKKAWKLLPRPKRAEMRRTLQNMVADYE